MFLTICLKYFSFIGEVWAPPESNPEFALIYDINGFISGMYSVVNKKYSYPDKYDFIASNWYRSEVLFGEQIFFTTAYFVDPLIICGPGRSQEEFDIQGTGDRLLFQSGNDRYEYKTAPLTVEEANADVR